ncbi:hypothetical protein BASA81_011031 [Batrachochytrium salamandrivorans]|nr:hypothetical protein BASA81_011031 [Batrachochytrium salamandrivorans]
METVKFVVASALDKAVRVEMEVNCVLRFAFKASSEIYFAMRFGDKEPDPKKRMWTRELELSVCSARDGTFVLDFDNSSSWVSEVQVELTYVVHFPPERGLERPLCFLLTNNALSDLIRESKNNLIAYCSEMGTREILLSRRRFLGFESRAECTKKTGRTVDFVVDDSFNLSSAVGSTDLHSVLLPLQAWQRPPISTPTTGVVAKLELMLDSSNLANLAPELHEEIIFSQRHLLITATTPAIPFTAEDMAISMQCGGDGDRDVETLCQAVRATSKQTGALAIVFLARPKHPSEFEPVLSAIHALHLQGHFAELGLAGAYEAWEIALMFHLCRFNGWLLPSVFQTEYHCLARQAEACVLPCIRAHGMRLVAVVHNEPGSERTSYQNVSVLDASLRWLHCHSQLVSGDGILFEPHSVAQTKLVVALATKAEPLPELVLHAIDKAWARTR